MSNYNKLYEIVYKTRSSGLKGVLNKFLLQRASHNLNYLSSISQDRAEKLNYLRACIKLGKDELEFKYATARKTFGKSTAVTSEQRRLIEKYMKFTSFILKDIPLKKQVKEFRSRMLLEALENFYKEVFGDNWLASKEIFLSQYANIIH